MSFNYVSSKSLSFSYLQIFAGHKILSCWPRLACGPQVAHAWNKQHWFLFFYRPYAQK